MQSKTESTPSQDSPPLRERLNLETGRIGWEELQRHFARGVVVAVAPGEDLVEVGCLFVRDKKAEVERLIAAGRLARAGDEQARDWAERRPQFWALVAAPWVLIQEITH